MRAGNLKHRFVLQKKNILDDGLGGRVEAWIDELTFNGSFEAVNPSEQYNYSQLNIQIDYSIQTRYNPKLVSATDLRLKKGDRILRIRSVLNEDNRRDIILYVSEDIVQ